MLKYKWFYIGLAILITFSALYVNFYMPIAQQQRAEISLKAYLMKLGIKNDAFTCNRDSDGDGFSSCTYIHNDKVVYLECDNTLIMNTHSCKKPKTTIVSE